MRSDFNACIEYEFFLFELSSNEKSTMSAIMEMFAIYQKPERYYLP